MSFAVMTDATANLPRSLAGEAGIGLVGVPYHIDGVEEVCLDPERFDGAAFYRALKQGASSGTSQVCPQRYIDAFEPVLQRGEDLIFLSMSSAVSGSCGSALSAAGQLRERFPDRRVHVVDTRSVSLGEGLVALEAARCRDEGLTLDAAQARLEAFVQRTCSLFTVDDLLYLRRSGRLAALPARVATVLQVKPLLKADASGRAVPFAKLRGRGRALEELAALYEALAAAPETQTVGVVHAGCPEDAERLVSLIRGSKRPPRQILCLGCEPVTGCHVGPGALALFFCGEDGVREAVDEAAARGCRVAELIREVKDRAADALGRIK